MVDDKLTVEVDVTGQDDEGFLRIVFAAVRSITAKARRQEARPDMWHTYPLRVVGHLGVCDSSLVRTAWPDGRQWVDVTNSGGEALTLYEIRITVPDVSVDVALTNDPAADIVLTPGETQRFQRTYAPSLRGAMLDRHGILAGCHVATHSKENAMCNTPKDVSRREFVRDVGLAALGTSAIAGAAGRAPDAPAGKPAAESAAQPAPTRPVPERKIRFAIVGHGVCQFGAAMGFQHHPNVEIVAVSDLVPGRRAALAKVCRCQKTYESLEVLVKDPRIEAVYVATDAPSHARHCLEVMKHGKHCISAVPAATSLEDCRALKEMKEKTGLKYMMAETSYYHGAVIRARNLYRRGQKLLYTEGHYYHHGVTRLGSWKNWRRALPPMYYPTHSTAYYVGVTGKRLTKVSCLGWRGPGQEWQKNNWDNNPFVNESALFGTSEETMCRINVFWWGAASGESGDWIWEKRPTAKVGSTVPLPKGLPWGGHGGSHGPLAHEYVTAILENREPATDIYEALAMTAPGIVAHQSALKGGRQMDVPSFDKA